MGPQSTAVVTWVDLGFVDGLGFLQRLPFKGICIGALQVFLSTVFIGFWMEGRQNTGSIGVRIIRVLGR